MRVITFTGKGGVGKTSVAAATALRLSELGLKTLVMSTDPAHSLSDSYDVPLSSEVKRIRENLYAIEVNAYVDLKDNWEIVQQYFAGVLMAQGAQGIMVDEMTILPGMEEWSEKVCLSCSCRTRCLSPHCGESFLGNGTLARGFSKGI